MKHQTYRWAMLAGLWLTYFAFGVVAASLAPIVPAVSRDLQIGNVAMGAILGAWPLIYIASAVPCGMVLDRLGARPSLLIASLFIGGSALARGLAETQTTMFLAVALFGIGGPLISVGAPKLVAQWFDGPNRGTAVGIYVTGPALGSAAALAFTHPVLLPLADGDWRMLMVGYALLAVASGAIWFAIASHRVARVLDISLATDRPALDGRAALELLASTPLRLVLAMGVLIFFVNHATNNWLPQILRADGLDAVAAGNWASVTTLVGIAGSLFIPRLAVPERRMAVAGLLFAMAALSFIALRAAPDWALMPSLVALGLARGSMVAVVMLILMDIPGVGPERIGVAGGLFFVAAEIGGVSGPFAIGALSATSNDFSSGLIALAAVSVALIGLVTTLTRNLGQRYLD